MKVPFLDWSKRIAEEKHTLLAAIEKTLDSGLFVLGPAVKGFEEAFSLQYGAPPWASVSCNSGTDALILALKAIDISAGDEVIVPSHTAVPTISAIEAVGAIPCFADIEKDSWLISKRTVEAVRTSRSRCVVAVHLYGNMVDVPAMSALGLPIIEDVAQAQGSRWLNQWAGTLGKAGAFSFYPTKNLGAIGDGGLLLTSDPVLAEKARMLRFYGQRTRYQAELGGGINSRLDELQAAILQIRLPILSRDFERKQKLVAAYREGLRGLPLEFQSVSPHCNPHWHLMVVASESEKVRDDLRRSLEEHQVGTLIHYQIPNHMQAAFSKYREHSLPVTESLSQRILSLPLYGELSLEAVEYVCSKIREYFER